jgi:predicted amidohydrolase YtcJ
MMIAGNGELDTYLNQLEKLGQPPRADERPWIVQHAAIAEPKQIKRLAALGIDLTTTMSFSWGKGERFAQRVGEDILEHLVPLRRLLDADIRIGCGTDWGPKNIFEHLALAIEPRYGGASGRQARTPGISRREALTTWTRSAAEVLQWNDIGSLVPGHHADLIIVDRNPLTCDLAGLADTKVMTTLLGGHPVAPRST